MSEATSPCFSKQPEDNSSTSFDDDTEFDKSHLISPFNPSPSPSTGFVAADHPGLNTAVTNNNIKVICRFRPEDEVEQNRGRVIVTFPDSKTVTVDGKEGTNTFTFDRVFQSDSSQVDIYKFSIYKSVDDLLNGYNGTVLAYGQTGSGKSYTMMGSSGTDESEQGVIPRISNEIFNRIQNGSSEIEYTVGVSFMEIHMEQIKDLIDTANNNNPDQKFSIHSDKNNGIYVRGLSQAFVSSAEELNDILIQGLGFRTSVSTNMNLESSRSHAIFQIKLTQKHVSSGIMKRSHLFLVDLAGSEKVDKTGAIGQTLEEAKKINSSLSSLGNVINALTDGKSTHVPYRDSKLTRILQESLGGNSRTSLIINCSPSSFNETETISTLRFGSRAKNIKNTAQINTELSASTLRQKLSQLEKVNENNQLYIKQLELELSQWRNGDRKVPQVSPRVSTQHSPRTSSISSIPAAAGSSIPTNIRNSIITPRTPTKDFQSKLPLPSGSGASASSTRILSGGQQVPASSSPLASTKSTFQLSEEVERRDKKIAELENLVLGMKMNDLRSSHTEESKLFTLENSLYKLNNKLNDVESINVNLRKHLLITEKIIESRDLKINKLKGTLKDQQIIISRETLGFRHKLGDIQQKLDILNKEKQEEIYSQARENIMRESMYSVDSKARDSMFYLDNKTKETFIDMDQKSFIEEQKLARRDANMSLRQNESKSIDSAEDKSMESVSSSEDPIVQDSATFSSEIPIAEVTKSDLQEANKSNHDVRQSSNYGMGTIVENQVFRTPTLGQRASFDGRADMHHRVRVNVPVASDDDLPECNLDDVQLPENDLSGDDVSLDNDEKASNSDTLASVETAKVNLKRFSLVESKKVTRDSSTGTNNKVNRSVSLMENDTILNFHQEYLSIGEFLAESKTRSSLIESIRNSVADFGEAETTDTSGMFDSPPNSPKPGLNLRIVKPLRGGNSIMQKINLFQ